jgi:hypothetical protein
MFGDVRCTRKKVNKMWILNQDKYLIVDVTGKDIELNYKKIIVYLDKNLFRKIECSDIRFYDSYVIAIYDYPERAAEVFEELLISLAKGDNLFRMPEK